LRPSQEVGQANNSEQTEALVKGKKNDPEQTEALARGQSSKHPRKAEALATGNKNDNKTLAPH
jgi:hypothetical protein